MSQGGRSDFQKGFHMTELKKFLRKCGSEECLQFEGQRVSKATINNDGQDM